MWRRLRNLEFTLGASITVLVVVLALLTPWLFPDGGEGIDLSARLTPPGLSWVHPLGTDPIGRDLLARVVVGARVSLTVGAVSVAGAMLLGTIAGLFAGFYRGVWDLVLMRWADVQLALPFILVAITFTAILGADMWKMIGFMAVTQWVQYARLVRGSGPQLARARVCPGRAGDRRHPEPDPLRPHPAQRYRSGHRADDTQHGQQYPTGEQPDLPRRRHRPNDPKLGRNAVRRTKLFANGVVGRGLSRIGDYADRAGPQSTRRLVA